MVREDSYSEDAVSGSPRHPPHPTIPCEDSQRSAVSYSSQETQTTVSKGKGSWGEVQGDQAGAPRVLTLGAPGQAESPSNAW